MNQNTTVSLLQEIYQNSRTAIDAIQALLRKSNSSHFNDSLRRQIDEYRKIADAATMQLRSFRELPIDNPILDKIGLWAGVQMSTLTNKNTDHMAEIMIDGSTAGVNSITRRLHTNRNVDPAASALAQQLIRTEQDNINLMRNFL